MRSGRLMLEPHQPSSVQSSGLMQCSLQAQHRLYKDQVAIMLQSLSLACNFSGLLCECGEAVGTAGVILSCRSEMGGLDVEVSEPELTLTDHPPPSPPPPLGSQTEVHVVPVMTTPCSLPAVLLFLKPSLH